METNERKLAHPEVNSKFWIPPVVLSGLLALFLNYLLLPGTLLYPTKNIQQNVDVERAVRSSLTVIEDNLKNNGLFSGHTDLISEIVSNANLILFSKLPPYLSFLLLEIGEKKECNK